MSKYHFCDLALIKKTYTGQIFWYWTTEVLKNLKKIKWTTRNKENTRGIMEFFGLKRIKIPRIIGL